MKFCEDCGAQLEDGAKFCDECGATINVEEEFNEEKIGKQAIVKESINKNNKKFIYIGVITVLFIVVIVISMIFSGKSHKDNSQMNSNGTVSDGNTSQSETQKESSSLTESETLTQSETSIESETQSQTQENEDTFTWKDAYKWKLEELAKIYGPAYLAKYNVCDIDKNGIPELVFFYDEIDRDCDAFYQIYTYDKDRGCARLLDELFAVSEISNYFASSTNENCCYFYVNFLGGETYSKVTIENEQLISKKIEPSEVPSRGCIERLLFLEISDLSGLE